MFESYGFAPVERVHDENVNKLYHAVIPQNMTTVAAIGPACNAWHQIEDIYAWQCMEFKYVLTAACTATEACKYARCVKTPYQRT